MLLIWDIHLQAKYTDFILDSIKDYVANHPEDDSVVFVWDYVYHFSYHRKSLLKLFAFFLELYQQGKHVFVLAGNHDWLGQHFVFAEGHYALDALGQLWMWKWQDWVGSIEFIVKPWFREIQGQNVYFLPFMINFDEEKKSIPVVNDWVAHGIQETATTLLKSKDKYEQISGLLNHNALSEVLSRKSKNLNKNLTIIHHYYLAKTKFPGQKNIFNYKDIALSPAWLKLENVRMISWHIHQSFSLENYICVWSIWSTSPLEYNQIKYLWQRDTKENTLKATPSNINPYLRFPLEEDSEINEEFLDKLWKETAENSEKAFVSPEWNIEFWPNTPLSLTTTTLNLQSATIDYAGLNELVEPKLQHSLKKVQLSRSQKHLWGLLEQLQTEARDFAGGWHDRKEILNEYIAKKYPEDKEKYMKELKELGLW